MHPTESTTTFVVLGFGICSSVMLVINKLAITALPAPGFILFLQCTTTAIGIRLTAFAGLIEVDRLLHPGLLRSFFPVAVGFLATLYCNSKALQHLNIETFIVCRSAARKHARPRANTCAHTPVLTHDADSHVALSDRNSTPIVISVMEFAFLGRELPDRRSTLCIIGMLAGAAGYAVTDSTFSVNGYSWLAGWTVAFLFDQIYIKHVVDSVPVASNWSRAMFTNAWAAIILFVMVAMNSVEQTIVSDGEAWTLGCVLAVGCSCVVALLISYMSFLARKQLTATTFTILGNACKILSVVLNVLIWDKHASALGLCMLSITLISAMVYTPAPVRTPSVQTLADIQDSRHIDELTSLRRDEHHLSSKSYCDVQHR